MPRRESAAMRYERVAAKIARVKSANPLAVMRGEIREKKAARALLELQRRGEILFFRRTEKLGFADVWKGVDFFAVVMRRGRRMVVPLSITGPHWVQSHTEKHPRVPVVAIKIPGDNIPKVVRKLRRVITRYESGSE